MSIDKIANACFVDRQVGNFNDCIIIVNGFKILKTLYLQSYINNELSIKKKLY